MKIAKSLLKTCKQEMNQIETCSECYQNANTKKDWFVEVCESPHILLWAKLKGFPYWPAKGMAVNNAALVDVRFFGAHDRAWVPIKDCYLYSEKNPNVYKIKKNKIVQCVKEIEIHIEKIKEKYGSFVYPEFRTPYDPANELEQIRFMIPNFNQTVKGPGSSLLPVLQERAIISQSATTPVVSVSTNSQITKTNLTYKIIKTADNNLLISPVVKPDKQLDFTLSKKEDSKLEEEDKRKSLHSSNSLTSPPVSLVSLSNSSGNHVGQSNPMASKELVKPTKIVIKNSYDHNNQKHYQLVNENVEECRKVESMIIKRKSDNWNVNSHSKKIKSSLSEPNINLEDKNTSTESTKRKSSDDSAPHHPETKIRIKRISKNKTVEADGPAKAKPVEPEPVKEEPVLGGPVESEENKEEEKNTPNVSNVQEMDIESSSEQQRISYVKEALDGLPQISIVPSRQNSVNKEEKKASGGGGAAELIEIRRVTRSESRSKEVTEVKEKEPSVEILPEPSNEPNVQIKSEPISDNEASNEVIDNDSSISRANSIPSIETVAQEPVLQPKTPQPRARKTFARSLNIRPKPVFNPNMVSANNMVCIPIDGNNRQDLNLVPEEDRVSGNASSPSHMLAGSMTPNLAAAVTEIISKTGPPRLTAKPTSTLQSPGDTIFPSEAGTSCRILMDNAHKITDFFRSVIEDTIADMADKGCLEARVKLLQLEIEKLKYSHKKEMAELKHNTGEYPQILVLKLIEFRTFVSK